MTKLLIQLESDRDAKLLIDLAHRLNAQVVEVSDQNPDTDFWQEISLTSLEKAYGPDDSEFDNIEVNEPNPDYMK